MFVCLVGAGTGFGADAPTRRTNMCLMWPPTHTHTAHKHVFDVTNTSQHIQSLEANAGSKQRSFRLLEDTFLLMPLLLHRYSGTDVAVMTQPPPTPAGHLPDYAAAFAKVCMCQKEFAVSFQPFVF